MKSLITENSGNPVTGSMLVTTSPRLTCPAGCPFKGGLCYGERDALGGFIWSFLDRSPVGAAMGNGIAVRSYGELLRAVRSLPSGAMWRHNQTGDLVHRGGDIDAHVLDGIIVANAARNGFTYTHHDVIDNQHNRRVVQDANARGFVINLSADNLSHADRLFDAKCGPVATILPTSARTTAYTPKGRKVVICPAITRGVTCVECRLCARQRDFIIGFPAHGPKAHSIVEPIEPSKPAAWIKRMLARVRSWMR